MNNSKDEMLSKLEQDYIELSEKYIQSQNELKKEKQESLKLIDLNIELTEQNQKLAEENTKLITDMAGLQDFTKHGAQIVCEDGTTVFIPFMSENMNILKNQMNRPIKMLLTFDPNGFMDWIKKVEDIISQFAPENADEIYEKLVKDGNKA